MVLLTVGTAQSACKAAPPGSAPSPPSPTSGLPRGPTSQTSDRSASFCSPVDAFGPQRAGLLAQLGKGDSGLAGVFILAPSNPPTRGDEGSIDWVGGASSAPAATVVLVDDDGTVTKEGVVLTVGGGWAVVRVGSHVEAWSLFGTATVDVDGLVGVAAGSESGMLASLLLHPRKGVVLASSRSSEGAHWLVDLEGRTATRLRERREVERMAWVGCALGCFVGPTDALQVWIRWPGDDTTEFEHEDAAFRSSACGVSSAVGRGSAAGRLAGWGLTGATPIAPELLDLVGPKGDLSPVAASVHGSVVREGFLLKGGIALVPRRTGESDECAGAWVTWPLVGRSQEADQEPGRLDDEAAVGCGPQRQPAVVVPDTGRIVWDDEEEPGGALIVEDIGNAGVTSSVRICDEASDWGVPADPFALRDRAVVPGAPGSGTGGRQRGIPLGPSGLWWWLPFGTGLAHSCGSGFAADLVMRVDDGRAWRLPEGFGVVWAPLAATDLTATVGKVPLQESPAWCSSGSGRCAWFPRLGVFDLETGEASWVWSEETADRVAAEALELEPDLDDGGTTRQWVLRDAAGSLLALQLVSGGTSFANATCEEIAGGCLVTRAEPLRAPSSVGAVSIVLRGDVQAWSLVPGAVQSVRESGMALTAVGETWLQDWNVEVSPRWLSCSGPD